MSASVRHKQRSNVAPRRSLVRRTFGAGWRGFKLLFLAVFGLLAAWMVYEIVSFPRVSRLRDSNPETTAMIETRLEEARAAGREPRRVQQWVPLARISPNLQRAVLAGEDANFATHNGFDFESIQKAWEEARREAEKEARAEGEAQDDALIPSLPNLDSFKRGGSTISQQLAKNLYLTSDRSVRRKAREALITYFMERDLSKRRILEIYLNVIEWGDGLYGAEAAARTYFNKAAADLTPQEAAFLSAMIPNPRTVFNPKVNPRRVRRRQRVILRGMPYVRLPAARFPASGRATNQLFVCQKPVTCTYWKKGVPGGSRSGLRNDSSKTQLRLGAL